MGKNRGKELEYRKIRYNRKSKSWRRFRPLLYQYRGNSLRLRRGLYAVLVVEMLAFVWICGIPMMKEAKEPVSTERIEQEWMSEGKKPLHLKKWGISVEWKEGVLRFWQTEEISRPSTP